MPLIPWPHVRHGNPDALQKLKADCQRMHLLAMFIAAAGIGAASCAGAVPAATLTDAVQQLQSGDPAGAAASLETVIQREPGNAQAWRTLGNAYRRLKDCERAIAAYRRTLELERNTPQAMYGIGVCSAVRADPDQAFMWLAKARDTHQLDMTQITVEVDLATLKSDARFAALLPTVEDFAQPFVEPVQIFGEWRGEAANDQFGWIARNIGDVDHDSVNDFVTSAPTYGAAGSHAGRICVYLTKTRRLLWQADGQARDELGTGEAAGDTNRDGVPDVVASGPAGAGVAVIYSGRDGRVLQQFASVDPQEAFGSHVCGVGDFNDDGYADVMVGSPGREGEQKVAGHIYVYSGGDGQLLHSLAGTKIGDRFGSTVAGRAERGHHLLIVGAPGAGPGSRGQVHGYDGASTKPAFTIDPDATGAALGMMFVSAPGDMDGDGVTEVYASDWSNAALDASTGHIYVHSGRSGRRLLTLTGEGAGEGFGTSASAAGDVDGDGRADLIVGAWQYGKAALSGGRAYLYSGKEGRLLRTFTCRTPGDAFGFDAVGMGDVDGDGTVDLLITSAWSGVSGFCSGRVFIVSSGITRPRSALGATP